MVHTNGRADLVGAPIQLGDFLPERREVELNGQRYLAWVVTNRRFPRSVQAELDSARVRYMRVVGPLLQQAQAGDDAGEIPAQDRAERERAIEQADVAYAHYMTEALVALVPGLGEQEADLIDVNAANRLLVELGYFKPAEAPAEASGDADPLTGAPSQVDSPATTQATPTSGS